MKRLVVPLAAVFGLAAGALGATTAFGPSPALAAAKISEPERVIRAIYESYPPMGSDLGLAPTGSEDKNFSPSLLKAWKEVEDTAAAASQVGVDWDVFIDAQDVDTVHDIVTTFAPDGPAKGTVTANFTVFGKEQTKTFPMVKTLGGWKIDNVIWGTGEEDNLRSVLVVLRKSQLEPQ
jgi:hypothetical protein